MEPTLRGQYLHDEENHSDRRTERLDRHAHLDLNNEPLEFNPQSYQFTYGVPFFSSLTCSMGFLKSKKSKWDCDQVASMLLAGLRAPPTFH